MNIAKVACEFAEGEFRDIGRECDVKEDIPPDLLKKGAELGFVRVDGEYSGAGMGFLEHDLILEEFWKLDPGLGQQFSSLTFGSEEQKKKYLPPLCNGRSIMGFALTDPDAGRNTASASTGLSCIRMSISYEQSHN